MYTDAAVFVLSLTGDEGAPHVSRSKKFVESFVRGNRAATTSVLTWDEVVYVIRRLLGPEDSREKAEDLLALPNLTWIPTDLAVIRAASALYRSLPLLPRDAIHAASAIHAGEREIVSEDKAFDHVPGLDRVWPPP